MVHYDLSPKVLEQVRHAADIVALVGEVISLRKAGKNYVGLCPFHGERTPSFYVSPDKGTFYCFGCRKGGSVFDFVMETQHLSFAEAVEVVAKRFGVPLPPASPGGRKRAEFTESLSQTLEAAQAFFLSHLSHDRPRAFLEARGVTLPQALELGLGFAPPGWRTLSDHLQRQGFSEELLKAAGLVVQGDQGRLWDRFRDRLTFPIRNFRGHLVAFAGRTLTDARPKYLNSPETPLFSKSTVLFGGATAAKAMAERGEAILVEGYFDCIALHLAGFPQAVATMGTALSEHHAKELARRVRRVVLCFDGDQAGLQAAKGALGTLLGAGLEVLVVLLPEGSDPDLFLRQQGPEAFALALRQALSASRFLLQLAGPSWRARREKLQEALSIVEHCPDPVRRFTLKEELARSAGIPLDQLGPVRLRPSDVANTAPPFPPAGELALLRALLVDLPEPERPAVLEQIPVQELQHPAARRVVEVLQELHQVGLPLAISALSTHINDREVRRLVAALEFEAPETTEEGLWRVLRELWLRHRKNRLAVLREEVRRAQNCNDQQALTRALGEMQLLLAKKVWERGGKSGF